MKQNSPQKLRSAFQLFLILSLTVLAYQPTLKNNFIYLDDDSHLLDNSTIRVLDVNHARQIFTTTVSKVYAPLTFLSFAVEYHFFRYAPFIYHLDNLLLHLAVTALVFYFALLMGLSSRAAFLAALLFGIHPMHVESVSWVTERKDVLYGFFYMLALCFYLKYLDQRKMMFYLWAILCGILSVLAKPMALSLPLVLLVLDWFKARALNREAFVDKVPHFLYVVPIAWITYSLNARIPGQDAVQALLIWIWSGVFYIHKFLFPLTLVPMYSLPQPVSLSHPAYVQAVCLLVLIACCLFRFGKNRWIIFAALFYFCSMFFLFRYDNAVDKSIVADRFMYLPCLGICLVFGHMAEVLLGKMLIHRRILRFLAVVCMSVVIGLLSVKTLTQTMIWKDSVAFWTYVIQKYPENALAYGNRGMAYKDTGKPDLAFADLNKSLGLNPQDALGYNNRGLLFADKGDMTSAMADFQKAILLRPDFAEAYNNIGNIYGLKGNFQQALNYFQKATKLDPLSFDTYANMGNIYFYMKQYDSALENFDKALKINPNSDQTYIKRGMIYGLLNNMDSAMADFSRALAVNPNNVGAYNNQGIVYQYKGLFDQAIGSYTKAIELNPRYADGYYNRGNAYVKTGQYANALMDFKTALEINPRHFQAKRNHATLIKMLSESSQKSSQKDLSVKQEEKSKEIPKGKDKKKKKSRKKRQESQ